MIKTKSINVFNLCVPCYNRCKYCLLSYNGNTLGIDYDRSITYAKGFYNWIKDNHPEIDFTYYFGYSMEHPKLIDAIKFMQEINSPMGEFLQMDGLKMRSNDQLYSFLNDIKNAGIKLLDFTFYGNREYHDKFAGRIGDYNLMINSINIALELGIKIEVGIPAYKSNLNQLDELVHYFSNLDVDLFIFTPHSGGRGKYLIDDKITINDYSNMSDKVKKYFNRKNSKTPLEWVNTKFEKLENRVISLSLLPSNIDKLELTEYDLVLKKLEEMDDEYYSIIPSFDELLKKYACDDDLSLYSKKDLYMIYRKRYILENNIDINDITDERYCGSVRY